MDTAQRITDLLNRDAATVTELAAALGISRNSAHLQVTKLEAAGIIEKYLPDTKSGVGKPAHLYRVKAGHEDAFSSAYKSILVGLIEILGSELSGESRINILEHTGKLLAKTAGLTPTGDLAADTQRAVEVVNGMGALAEMRSNDDAVEVNCHTCPVASMVHKDPMVCNLVAAYFAEATGNQATVQCQHGRTVVCGFAVEKQAA